MLKNILDSIKSYYSMPVKDFLCLQLFMSNLECGSPIGSFCLTTRSNCCSSQCCVIKGGDYMDNFESGQSFKN